MKIPLFQDRCPDKTGYYLFRGGFTDEIRLLKIKIYTAIDYEYLGVAGQQGDNNVKKLIGFFSEKLEF